MSDKLTTEAELIREARTALGMSQVKFGAYLGEQIGKGEAYSKQRIWNWENGTNGMDILDVAYGKLTYPEDDPRGKLFRELWALKAPGLEVTAKEPAA